MIRTAVISLAAAALAACGGGNPPPLGNGDGGHHGGGADGGTPWVAHTVIDTGGVGNGISVAATPGGMVAAAYWTTTSTTNGQCPYNPPVDRNEWELRYATRSTAGWNVETVASVPLVGAPRGVALSFAPDGSGPVIAAKGGPVAPPGPIGYCGANDADLYHRGAGGTWTPETAASLSADAIATSGDTSYDVGFVVGDWPGLAWDSSGQPAIAYKDVHFGGEQHDDLARADLELAWKQGGGWTDLPIDMGEGAGDYNALAFDTSGRPIVLYVDPLDRPMVNGVAGPPKGLFIARADTSGANWTRVELLANYTPVGSSIVVAPKTGTVWVAWYDRGEGMPWVGELTDETQFGSVSKGWKLTRIGDNQFDEGQHPSIAAAPDGRVAVAYYRCVLATGGIGNCDPNDDALIFAWEAGGTWTREVVDTGGDGLCGMNPSLTFTPDGHAEIVYQCSVKTSSGFDLEVLAAERDPLP